MDTNRMCSDSRTHCVMPSLRWRRGRWRGRLLATMWSTTTSTTRAQSSRSSTGWLLATSAKDSSSGDDRYVPLEVLNPATERSIAQLERAGVEETDRAVAAARAAYP